MQRTFHVPQDTAGLRLDQFLVAQLGTVSRARVQELIGQEKVLVNGAVAKASTKLRGGERVEVTAEAERRPLRAVAEDIPLDVVYEDEHLAVINKPAGMMVHAGAGRSEGTLVNALLHRFGRLSAGGHALRPGIVHRLDKETSGLIVVAKDDATHHALQQQFAGRSVKKRYVALVHGWPKAAKGTIEKAIARDPGRRTRMTTRTREGRSAVSHYRVLRRIDSPYGKLALIEIKIDTGRTHQIRVHMAALGHPVAGDRLYGAPAQLKALPGKRKSGQLSLPRNFLHAAELEFTHPATGGVMHFRASLAEELRVFMEKLGEGKLPDGI